MEWIEIEGTGGCYLISDTGSVEKISGRGYAGRVVPYLLQQNDNGAGYKTCNLKLGGGENKVFYIHRLVATAFIDNPEDLKYVGHKDHDKSNNSVGNLYWTTASDNTSHGVRDGKINQKGRYKGGGKISTPDSSICEMYVRCKLGEEITSVAKEYGISRTTLSSWLNKRSKTELTDLLDLDFV